MEFDFEQIDALFYPKSIAIVGASADPDSRVNQGFLRPLLKTGFPGKIYPVNPKYPEIMGLKTYASIRDIPEQIDYVLCAVPATTTIQLMRDCVAAEVKAVAVYTAGFSESGEEEGTRLEKELVEIARQGGVRILGPNCLGIHSPAGGLYLEEDCLKEKGHVAFFSQSGGNTRDLIILGASRGIYFNKAVSYGNAIDLNESDFLEYFVQDPDTRVIAAYIEGIKQPQRFAEALKKAAGTKPVIILKGGITRAGARAVVSHTSAQAPGREDWNDLCRQSGAIQVSNLEEMADAVLAFSYFKPPRGRRVGIVGTGGGITVQAADDCENAGLELPSFPQELTDRLKKDMPMAGASLRNPIDAPAQIYWNPPAFSKTIELVGKCDDIDAVLVILITRYALQRQSDQTLIDQISAISEANKIIDKPLAVILLRTNTADGERINFEMQARCFKAGLAPYPSVYQAAQALNRFIEYHERRMI